MTRISLSPAFRSLALKWLWRSVSSGHFAIGMVFDPMTRNIIPRESIQLPKDAVQRWSEYDDGFFPTSLAERAHFTLVEAAWLRFLLAVERNGIPLHELDGMRKPFLHDRRTIRGFIASPVFKKAILILLPKKARERAAKALTSPSDLTDKLIDIIPTVSTFDALVCAYAHFGLSSGLFRDMDGNWTLVSHDVLREGMLDSSAMTQCFQKHGAFISVDGLLDGLHETSATAPKPHLTALSENERTLLSYLRDGTVLKRLSIRFDQDGEMSLLELTCTQILESTRQIENIIRSGGYYNVTVEAGNGEVFNFEHTKKIKLN